MVKDIVIYIISLVVAGIITLILYIQSRKHSDNQSQNKISQQLREEGELTEKTNPSHVQYRGSQPPCLSDYVSKRLDQKKPTRKEEQL